MSKQIAFVARDTDLIRRIEEYQQETSCCILSRLFASCVKKD